MRSVRSFCCVAALLAMESLAAPAPGQPAAIRQGVQVRVQPGLANRLQPRTLGVLTVSPNPLLCREPAGKRTGSLLVLVNGAIAPKIRDSIATYTADLARQGYATTVYSVTVNLGPLGDVFFRSFRDLKWLIKEWWLSLASDLSAGKLGYTEYLGNSGVVLVGEFPVPILHGRIGYWEDKEKGTSGCYEGCFVSDLFLTDLDGHWDTVDQAFLPLYSTVDVNPAPDSECVPGDEDEATWLAPPSYKLGKAGARPEIFLGRISAAKVAGNAGGEVQMIKDYFVRNHEYRTGKWGNSADIPIVGNCVAWPRLAYYDDDWVEDGQLVANAMQKAWRGPVTANPTEMDPGQFRTCYVSSKDLTTKADYQARLKATQWLWVDFLAHSNPWLHEIHVGDQKQNLWSTEVATGGFRSLFYWIQGCDSSDITKQDNLGETYLFRAKALAVIGNTSVGPLDNGQFYTCLGWGDTIGQAFMVQEWLHGHAGWSPDIARPGTLDPKRYYQWVLLGDPTLPTVPPEAPQYSQLVTLSARLRGAVLAGHLAGATPEAFARRAIESVRGTRPDLATERAVVVQGLKPGLAYLEPGRETRVVDPQWRTHVSRGVNLAQPGTLRPFVPLKPAPPRPGR